MKFLRSWIEEYVDLKNYTNKQLANLITNHSSEVDGFEEIHDYFGNKVVVGKISNLRKHPDADKLNIFDVIISPDGSKKVQIVSAASNARDDIYIPVALEGAKLPNLTITARPLRGVMSQGMCCGKSELMLETGHSTGLWELDLDDTYLGKSICEVYPDLYPSDTLFDIKVLPDRLGNIGSYMGIALEIGRILGKPELLKGLAKKLYEKTLEEPKIRQSQLKINFVDDTDYTNRFNLYELDFGREYILPHNLTCKLFLSGINLVNGPTDLSNYLLYDLGQPTHFFSYNKLFQNNNQIDWKIKKIPIATGFKGLGNLKNTTLPSEVITMQNGTEIVTIPAISGGNSTKIENDCKVILEIANFDAESVARNIFKLKYRSDAAKIWAGGVHPARIELVLHKITEILGADISLLQILHWNKPNLKLESDREIEVDLDYISHRLDNNQSNWTQKIEAILNKLGNYNNKKLKIYTPEYSNILDRESLVTEISNHLDYKELEPDLLKSKIYNFPADNRFYNILQLKKSLILMGLNEVITRPFIHINSQLDTPSSEIIKVLKPQNEELNTLRANLISSTLQTISKNLKNGEKDIKLFEINKTYLKKSDNKVEEKELLAIGIENKDPQLITTIIIKILGLLNIQQQNNETKQSQLGEEINYSKQVKLIQINNKTKKQFDIALSKNIWVIEVNLTNLKFVIQDHTQYTDTLDFPSIERNYSILTKLKWSQILEQIKLLQTEYKLNIQPTERLKINNQDSLSFSVEFNHPQKTPTSEDIDQIEKIVFANLKKLDQNLVVR